MIRERRPTIRSPHAYRRMASASARLRPPPAWPLAAACRQPAFPCSRRPRINALGIPDARERRRRVRGSRTEDKLRGLDLAVEFVLLDLASVGTGTARLRKIRSDRVDHLVGGWHADTPVASSRFATLPPVYQCSPRCLPRETQSCRSRRSRRRTRPKTNRRGTSAWRCLLAAILPPSIRAFSRPDSCANVFVFRRF